MAPVDGLVLKFAELEGPDGAPARNITFSNFELQPLGYEDLLRARLHEPLTIPFVLRQAEVAESDIPGLDKTRRYDARTTLESPFTSQAIGCVHGGWLPSALASTDPATVVLLDRNIVTRIVGRGADRGRSPANPDFLDLFQDRAVRLNPLLYVLEGNRRTTPDAALVEAQLAEVVNKLAAALPKAELLVGPGSLEGALGLLSDSAAGLARKQGFLREIAPVLCMPVSRAARQARWQGVLDSAGRHDLSSSALVVMAALSAVAVVKGPSPARRLLKFRPGYQQEDAYNALVDLRALELLMCFMALYPEVPIQLCTGDRDLALLWCGLGARSYRQTGEGFTFDLEPSEALFPGETLGWWARMSGESPSYSGRSGGARTGVCTVA